jgi:hypothetical protein
MGARNRYAPSIHHNKWVSIAFSLSPAIAESYAGAFAYSF